MQSTQDVLKELMFSQKEKSRVVDDIDLYKNPTIEKMVLRNPKIKEVMDWATNNVVMWSGTHSEISDFYWSSNEWCEFKSEFKNKIGEYVGWDCDDANMCDSRHWILMMDWFETLTGC